MTKKCLARDFRSSCPRNEAEAGESNKYSYLVLLTHFGTVKRKKFISIRTFGCAQFDNLKRNKNAKSRANKKKMGFLKNGAICGFTFCN